MSQIGVPGLVLIILVALLLFGPKKLPELGRAAGRTLREFKDSVSGIGGDERRDRDESEKTKADARPDVRETAEPKPSASKTDNLPR